MDSFLRKRVLDEGDPSPLWSQSAIAGSVGSCAERQVAHELELIAKLGFAGYFLIVWDIVAVL